MIFKGEISRFNALDLLMFLINLGKEGLLTVSGENESLRISIKDGFFVDAYSDQADDKTLRALFYKRMINKEQFRHVRHVKRETKMPTRQILEELRLFPLSKAQRILENSVREVLFQLLLCESGQFHFADILADEDSADIRLDCQGTALEMATWVDEWKAIVQSLNGLDRAVVTTGSGNASKDVTFPERLLMNLADGRKTVEQIVKLAPFASCRALKVVHKLLSRGCLQLGHGAHETALARISPDSDSLFAHFKRTFRKIILSKDLQAKVSEFMAFCQDHFDGTLVMKTKDYKITGCTVFYRDKEGQMTRKEIKDPHGRIDDDPVFLWVYRSGMAFSGKVFSNNLTRIIKDLPTTGECGVMSVTKDDGQVTLVYVVSDKEDEGITAFHYLELLSWLIKSPKEMAQWKVTPQPKAFKPYPQEQGPKPLSDSLSGDKLALLVKSIEDLPAMPHIITRIHQILSDPDSSMWQLTPVLAQDQSLVAEIIRVSNSALYGSDQRISNLNLALTRLGAKTIRSIVVTASTRSFFSINQTTSGTWSRPLWQHSKECAIASRRVAERVGYHDPEEAFVGGLLHDIGKLVLLLILPEEYARIRKRQAASKTISIRAENHVLGFDHTSIGELLMKKWKMPESLTTCVRHHHPHDVGQPGMLSFIVAYGDYLSHLHGSDAEEIQDEGMDVEGIMENLNLSDEQIQDLHDVVIGDFRCADVFD
ncbi:MAG: HDOD domain-containing protein [Thermodesulfobacteriota bacterium]|nr:HDOD domain-containing protein [Thermodesulfobacteriota bacterium]